jgi:hypothetical protein
MKSEEWICIECERVTNHPGSRRWRATGDEFWPVTLWCPAQQVDTKHWREPNYRQWLARKSRQEVARESE